jgi:ribosomal protein S12 methylthiotransferase accessory factor
LLLTALDLDSDAGATLLSALAGRHGEAMVRAARLPARLFAIRSPSAPGLCCIGGEVQGSSMLTPGFPPAAFSVTGSGVCPEDALASCLGEGVERLSQLERPGDVVFESTYDQTILVTPAIGGLVQELVTALRQPGPERLAWVRGRLLSTQDDVLLPADWCLRRPVAGPLRVPGAALSIGCAAGPTFEAAAARALLELVERDAAALWWLGGQRPKPVAVDETAMQDAVALCHALRRGERRRATWLLDITADLDIPCMAAVSVDADGRGLCCGLAARLTPEAAARAAILEMCQMELAVPIVEAKRRERGDAALNEGDRKHLTRATRIDATCALLHPHGAPRRQRAMDESTGGPELERLQAAFSRCAIEAALVNLSRPDLAIPVAHAVAPALQLLPARWTTRRLSQMQEATGGGEGWNSGVPLL